MTLLSRLYSPAPLHCLLAAACLGLLAACAGIGPSKPLPGQDVEWLAPSAPGRASVVWQHHAFPGKQATLYQAVGLDGRLAIQSESSAAASMLRHSLRLEPADLGLLRFSWKVPELIAGANLSQRDGDDSPVRVVLAFEGDRAKFSDRNAMLSELSLMLTGEPLPYATLMYVWGNQHAPGSIVTNPRTDRVRKLVLESGPQQLGRWRDYERDIRADFEQAFGEAPGALVGIGLMTDTDNTRQRATAWYGPLSLLAASGESVPGAGRPVAPTQTSLNP